MTGNALDEIRRQAKKNKREKEKTDIVDQIMFSFDKTDELIEAGLAAQKSFDVRRVCVSMPHNPNPVIRRCVFTIKLSMVPNKVDKFILAKQIHDPLRKDSWEECETVSVEDLSERIKMTLVEFRLWARNAFDKYNTALFSVSGGAVYVDQEGRETDGEGKPLGLSLTESDAWYAERNKQDIVYALEHAKYEREDISQYMGYTDSEEALHRIGNLEKKMDLILDTLIKILEKN